MAPSSEETTIKPTAVGLTVGAIAGGAITALGILLLAWNGEAPAYGWGIPELSLEPLRGTEVAQLTHPPQVPPPIERDYAAHVVVNLETVEVTKRLAEGVDYRFWTFGGTVPGSFIRVREGDEVELRLQNDASSIVPHDIDLHAATGPGGGSKLSWTAPGDESVFTFRALKPGLYVYHCAVPSVGQHIANGMYGLILVQPRAGLPPVDHEYYVMQGEFYTEGRHGEPGLEEFSYEKAMAETPEYVVFNGAEGSLTGDNALTAEAGETVRLFVGNGGPNLISSFHVIGEIFDNVYREGGTAVAHDVQTTLVPAGGSAIVELRADVPGEYVLVDHSIFRAVDRGASGILRVGGSEQPSVIHAGGSADGAASIE